MPPEGGKGKEAGKENNPGLNSGIVEATRILNNFFYVINKWF